MARFRYQKGQLYLHGKGKEKAWIGRWREDEIGEDGTVKRKRRNLRLGGLKDFPTRRLALRELERRLAAVNDFNYRPQHVATFGEFAAKWRETVLGSWKPSSAANARSHLRKYLVPYFGKMQLRDIGPETVQRFVATLATSPKTTRNLVMTLRSVWDKARAYHYVSHDAFDHLELRQALKRQRFFFSLDQVRLILTAAVEPYRTLYWLAYETGFRAGELCGLRTSDVDMENAVVWVRQSVWGGREQEPKSRAAVRQAAISPELHRHLRLYLRAWQPNARALLFATSKGTPLDPNLVLKRKFKPLLASLGIPIPKGDGFHSFRHGVATEMDHRHVPLAVRQVRMGHSDPRLTLGCYTHPISADERTFVDSIGKELDPAKKLDRLGPQKEKLDPAAFAKSSFVN